MQKHLEKMGEVTFDKIFSQRLGNYIYVSSMFNIISTILTQGRATLGESCNVEFTLI